MSAAPDPAAGAARYLPARLGDRLLAVNRKMLPRLVSGRCNYLIVNEFPKCGGTWVSHMLGEALGLPFPQHTPLGLRPAVVHGHFLRPEGLRNVLVVWRDPRDVFVSYYYHCYFVNEFRNRRLVELMKRRLPFADYSDIRANLPTFIAFLCETPVSPRFTWTRFAEIWLARPGVTHLRYEDMRTDGPAELRRVARELAGVDLPAGRAAEICERHDFDRVKRTLSSGTGARPSVEMSFMREGSTGGWRRHFTDEARDLVERHCGAQMRALGYLWP